jgi:curved DNA-binding protein CbpA
MIDLYKLLGIKRGATREEIRKAYRVMAKIFHPDSGGSVQQFSALATAHEVLSDTKRRERYDATGEIEQARPDNPDVGAMEIIAQKLGLILHAEHDVTSMDIGALIEQAICDDIARRKSSIADQKRAIERAGRLRGRVKRKEKSADNTLAGVLDWHERSAKDLITKHEEGVATMQRALEILDGYHFEDEFQVAAACDEVSEALRDTIRSLEDLAAILNTQPNAAVN